MLIAAGNDDPAFFWSDGETMWVVDVVLDKLFTYKMSDQSRDGSKDISLGGGNDHPLGVWGGLDVAKLWVLDAADHHLYPYDLSVPATGVAISGMAQVGETLTADTSNIMDPNGIPDNVTFTYQWFSSDDGDTYTEIAGETGSSYTLQRSDVGKTIRVEVSFTDNAGYAEQIYSDSVTLTIPKNFDLEDRRLTVDCWQEPERRIGVAPQGLQGKVLETGIRLRWRPPPAPWYENTPRKRCCATRWCEPPAPAASPRSPAWTRAASPPPARGSSSNTRASSSTWMRTWWTTSATAT